MGKDTVSRTWRKVKRDWDAWNARSLADEPIVRLILDGTVVRVRLDRKATAISLLVVIGVRADGQKVLLAVKSMGSESAEAWRAVLDDLIKRGLRRPEFLIVDGAVELDQAIAAVWDSVPVQRCTVHIAGRDPHFRRGGRSPPRANPCQPGSLGSGVAGQPASSKQTRHVASVPSQEARANAQAAPKGNALAPSWQSGRESLGESGEWGGRVRLCTDEDSNDRGSIGI